MSRHSLERELPQLSHLSKDKETVLCLAGFASVLIWFNTNCSLRCQMCLPSAPGKLLCTWQLVPDCLSHQYSSLSSSVNSGVPPLSYLKFPSQSKFLLVGTFGEMCILMVADEQLDPCSFLQWVKVLG